MRAIRVQPNRGLRCFIETMAAINSLEGPVGPGLLGWGEENNKRYLRVTNARWNFRRVAGLITTAGRPDESPRIERTLHRIVQTFPRSLNFD